MSQPCGWDARAENRELILEPFYSIVIPAYNESGRLRATLERVLAYVHAQGWDAEVIVVNDGSRDNTASLVLGYAGRDARVLDAAE